MQEINFRPAKLIDLPVLYEFEQGIVTAERPFDPTLKPGYINYYDLKELILSDDAEVIVATFDNKVIGSGYAKIKKGESFQSYEFYAYLGFMYVKPEHRGKGVVRNLIDVLKSWATSKNLTEIRLEVYEENHSAIRAYEKAGFKKHMVEMRI
jgi:ribosomal protein S18 acetylase RimI-like enzyme